MSAPCYIILFEDCIIIYVLCLASKVHFFLIRHGSGTLPVYNCNVYVGNLNTLQIFIQFIFKHDWQMTHLQFMLNEKWNFNAKEPNVMLKHILPLI